MKKLINISVALILAICFFGCEKDDICASSTPTTSRMIVEFYDFNNPAVLKSVTDLSAFGNGSATGVIFNNTVSDSTRFFMTGTSVALPLDISTDSTTYQLRIFSRSPEPAVFNDDFININYSSQQIYVSRACGFKTIFDLENVTRVGDSNDWIRNITFEPITIDNEEDVHVKIYW